MVAGLTAYGFLVVSSRVLDKAEYAPLSVLWSILFLAGPGFFLPLEQEVSRALAGRRARNHGGGPVIKKAAVLGGGLAAALLLVVAASSQFLLDHLFDEHVLLLVGFALGLVGYYCEHLSRGTFSGQGRFRPYSTVIGAEGAIRFLACVLLAIVGVKAVGPYGLALGLAPLLAVLVALRGQHNLVVPGPEADWAELSTALGALLAGSVLAQGLVFGGPLAVKLLASGPREEADVGRFLNGLVIARIPLFLFQAVQAALLPKLSALAAAGRLDDFRVGFRRLLVVVACIAVTATVGAFAIGPTVVEIMFGPKYDLGNRTLGLLAMSSSIFMLAIAMAQAVIALGGHTRMALSWLAGVITFLVVTAMGNELFLRVEIGLVAGCAVAALAMAAVVTHLIRSGAPVDPDGLLEALHDIPIET
jgi:O-antigen/teichoic acid export membrane protein